MTPLADKILAHEGRLSVGSVPDGADGYVLGALAGAADTPLVFVARDEVRARGLIDALHFFAPTLDPVFLPAWDCLPYDRVSPNPSVIAERMAVLSLLAQGQVKLLVTTINALGQRVPMRSELEGAALSLKAGAQMSIDDIADFLSKNGYQRVGTVIEAGDFAIRGGLLDMFPPGHDHPVRLDFFGDEIESIRTFDPVTQRSLEKQAALSLVPATEFTLDPDTVTRFRSAYVARFGAVTKDDPLYEAVSEARRYQGMEHWLPLFCEGLDTLEAYVPNARFVLDHHVEDAADERLQTIKDYYDARQDDEVSHGSFSIPAYKPLPPDALYLTKGELDQIMSRHEAIALSPFAVPDGVGVIDFAARAGRNFGPERLAEGVNLFEALKAHLADLVKGGKRAVIAAYSEGARDRLTNVLADHDIKPAALVDSFAEIASLPQATIGIAVLPIEAGFEHGEYAVIAEQDVLGDRMVRQASKRKRAEDFLTDAATLSVGDLVVHAQHGIGRYDGLETIDVVGIKRDCLALTYHGDDRLFLPVENIELLSRYGGEGEGVQLDRLGGVAWQSRKARLKKRLLEMAEELIRIAAARELRTVEKIVPQDGAFAEFCARFPYQETEDQQNAIDDVLDDFAGGKPMDRLVCGDVGFGKTEVALRAAFVAAMAGQQVAVVVPTTLLARQHYKNFTDRFKGLPLRVGRLSRLVGQAEAKATREELRDGKLDIVVGTHALLQEGIAFKDLGLLIIDEEQHFGVKHKERLKEMRSDVHVLTLTATPIPRTLQLAMTGVRDLSLIATPPVDRLAVRTFVTPYDSVIIRESLLREHYRGGQSFYVCPRISDLQEVAEFLKDSVPEVKFAIAHGQMAPGILEDIMTAFYDGQFDVLLSTTIVESGLDIPTANTMIVHRADMFGLAQLYQIRGRIGRSKTRAYCYLTHPANRQLNPQAEKRLKILQSLDTLGAGFTLASHDLDLRGAGNLLGDEQSGHIREVGFELYREMLEEAIASLRDGGDLLGGDDEKWSPQINLGTAVMIPESYVADLDVRLTLYRRLSGLATELEIEGFGAELIDRFGPMPEECDFLLKIVAIKLFAKQAGIEKIDAGPKGATVSFRNDNFANPAGLIGFVQDNFTTVKMKADHKMVYRRDWDDITHRLKGALSLARKLATIAREGAQDAAE